MREKEKDKGYRYRDNSNDPVKYPRLDAGYGGGWSVPPLPEPPPWTPEPWPEPKVPDPVFAKSCIYQHCFREPTEAEPSTNFGQVMVAGAMALPAAAETAAQTLGADVGLGRMGGQGIMQQRMTWVLRAGAGAAISVGGLVASVLILGLLPRRMGDGTLYSDEQLRHVSRATTRVRFQFRQDAEGELQIYGIHTGPNGDDSVPTVQVKWNANKTALEAELSGITILWTPRDGRLGPMPPLTYPDDSGAHLGTILVHPISQNTDNQIEGLPGEDISVEDCILVFPADSGLNSLYVVYAKPHGVTGDHKYHPPPGELPAFPTAKLAPSKNYVQRGGKKRRRWKDDNGKIYEWDFQHGKVELYSKQGKHLGEFDPETGEQTKPANPTRKVEK